MSTPESERRRYYARKVAGQCVRCGAELLPEWDALTCPECTKRTRDTQKTYEAREERREMRRLWERANYRRNAKAFSVKKAEQRANRKALGLCVYCRDPASETSVLCDRHRTIHNASTIASKRRRSA